MERIEEIVGKEEMNQDVDEEESEEEEVALLNLEQPEEDRLESVIRFEDTKSDHPEPLKRDRTFSLINKSKGKVTRFKDKLE